MNINSICHHPAEIDIEAVLSHSQAYPDHFTLADRTAEKMTRIRAGLVHIFELLPTAESLEQRQEMYCWLSRILMIVDIAKMDAEGKL